MKNIFKSPVRKLFNIKESIKATSIIIISILTVLFGTIIAGISLLAWFTIKEKIIKKDKP